MSNAPSTDDVDSESRSVVSEPSSSLFNRGYCSLLVVQFLGAANDNILKQCLTFMVATGIWSGRFEEGGLGEGGQVFPVLCLTIPFILLSGYAGQVADRFSKRSVMLGVKVAELPIAVIGFIGFFTQNLWLTLAALLLLSIQSSFFGPAKFGVIPELVRDKHLSLANGLLNMFTNLAVIIGSLAAGPLSDAFDPTPIGNLSVEPRLWAPGVALILVAILGIFSILPMPKLRAAQPNLKYDLNPFGTYIRSLREMAQSPLLAVTLAWSGFYMIGMMALMIVPEYEAILNIDYTKTSLLLGALGVSIAVGSVLAGVASGSKIRPDFVAFGAAGMAVFFFLLGAVEPSYANVVAFILGIGFFAGFYIVPLQALLQHLSPDDERGRFLGTANALSFCFSTVGAMVYWLAANPIGMAPNRVHLICGTLALVGLFFGLRYRRLAL
jgi:MFS family permease